MHFRNPPFSVLTKGYTLYCGVRVVFQQSHFRVVSPVTMDNVRYGEVRRALSGAKGRNERTYGLGGAPVVIVHGNQRHELA